MPSASKAEGAGSWVVERRITVATDQFAQILRQYTAYRDDLPIMNHPGFLADQLLGGGGDIPAMWAAVRQADALSQHADPVVIEGPFGSDKLALCAAIQAASESSRLSRKRVSCPGLTVGAAKAVVQNARKCAAIAFTQTDRVSSDVQDYLIGVLSNRQHRKVPRFYFLADRNLSELRDKGEIDPTFLTVIRYDHRLIVPPLAKHRWDIMPLVLSEIDATPGGEAIRFISYAAAVFLTENDWTGDVQELREITRAGVEMVLGKGLDTLTLATFNAHFRAVAGTTVTADAQSGMEHLDSIREFQRARGHAEVVGSESMGRFYDRMLDEHRFRYPSDDRERVNGGWDAFEQRNGYCPVLFVSDVGPTALLCKLTHDSHCLNHKWFVDLPEGRWTFKESEEAYPWGERWTDHPEVTLEDADTVFLFDVNRIRDDIGAYCSDFLPPIDEERDPGQGEASRGKMLPQTEALAWLRHDAYQFLGQRAPHLSARARYEAIAKVETATDRKCAWQTVKKQCSNCAKRAATGDRPSKCGPRSHDELAKLYAGVLRR
jgi:hypothetical protein